ncbi:class I SAM-dependent methyltransferase [Brevibacillus ginsengisoli]|uniref:class I SAM-dependent methyltransferase n=1 Tax=Brevibacillus ginsengisoli TaxID=363854 RepID=UPI003CEBD9EF
MYKNKASITALISAFGRAYHARNVSPIIFDDYLASQMLTEEEFMNLGKNLARALPFFAPEEVDHCPDEQSALAVVMRVQSTPITVSRARYTEDSLEALVDQGVQQYVILGAGLDTFAFREPELCSRLQVFEVDHPATQELKRRRLEDLGWQLPQNLHFVPVDFNQQSLISALEQSSFDPSLPSFFSWLGVTYYLHRDVVLDTLRSIANFVPSGSSIIFDYLDAHAFIPERTAIRVKRMQNAVQMSGEPMITGLDPTNLAAELAIVGLRLEENLSPADIQERYFKNRTDGYTAFEHVHFARAVVK